MILGEVGGAVLLAATTPEGTFLHRSDGTPEGTARIATAAPVDGASPEPLPSTGPECAVSATEGRATVYLALDDGDLGTELWATDASQEGVRLVADIDPDGSSDPELLGSVGDALLFTADDGLHGRQLMATDGQPGWRHQPHDRRPPIESAPSSGRLGRAGRPGGGRDELPGHAG